MIKTHNHFPQDFQLDKMRLQGDAQADRFIQDRFSNSGQKKALFSWLSDLHKNKDLVSDHPFLDRETREALNSMLLFPDWINEEKLSLARKYFARNSPWIMNLLGLLSLPFCYAAADGARVLCFTERLTKSPEDRLRETAEFIWEIMDPKSFEPDSKALVSILKVRLMHAVVRQYILQEPEWRMEWGIPINQEDMAGTNLAFSLVVLRGLRKVGISTNENEKDAFLHLWNVVGHLLGLEKNLLPEKVRDTILLEKTIRERHFKESDHGKFLTRKLMEYFNSIPKDPKKPKVVLQNWMVELISEEISSLIDLKPLPEKGIPLKMIFYLNQLGILDPRAGKATYESRYKTYLNNSSESHSAPGFLKDYSRFSLPLTLKWH